MNRNDIQRSLHLLDYDSYEIRVINPNRNSVSSQFIHPFSELLPLCQKHDGLSNLYVGINERNTTNATKRDIQAVNFLVMDLDSVRPDNKQPANQPELDATIQASQVIMDWFADHGFCSPVRAISGNGCHIWIRIPRLPLTGLEMTTEWESRVKRFYLQMESVLPSHLQQKVQIDSIQDVTRIIKLIGTTSVKADPTEDRPNRLSFWLDDPESMVADGKLFDYINSLKPEVQIKSAPTLHFGTDKLSDKEQKILDDASSSYHVQKARMEIDLTDRSVEDYALAKELVKEGVGDPRILKHALMTIEGTRYQRDGDESYVNRTLDNLLNSLSGMPLLDARTKLEHEFQQIETVDNGLTLCPAPIATGKSHCARRLVLEQAEAGESVLLLTPSHAVAGEWERKLNQEKDDKVNLSIVRLYGLDNDAVDCPYKSESRAKSLIELGYSAIFRDQFCKFCSLKESCLYYQGHQQAEDADILIAQHSHAQVNPHFYGQASNGNQNRRLVVIDEMPQLVHCVPIRENTIKQNIKVLKGVKSKTNFGFCCQWTLGILEGMLKAIQNKTSYQFDELTQMGIDRKQINALKFEVANQFKDESIMPKSKNLLWDLELIIQRSLSVDYCDLNEPNYRKCLVYRWKPYLGNKRTIILSATTESAYFQHQGFTVDQVVAEDLEVGYQNLKVVQLIDGNGGKTSVLDSITNESFAKRHGKWFDLMLRQHEGETLAIVASQGDDGQEKQLIINALSSVAEKHSKELIPTGMDQFRQGNIADGEVQIPIFHYGINGVNDLEEKYSVIWFLYAYYYNPASIMEGVFKKHGKFIKSAEKQEEIFHELLPPKSTRNYKVYRYQDELGNLELKHGQEGDMIQMEGRFLREDKKFKTIYRTHPVNIKPYPGRVYSSWEDGFFKAFYQVITKEELMEELTEKQQQIVNWIVTNAKDREFTSPELARAIDMDTSNMRSKYLMPMVWKGLLEDAKRGNRKYFKLHQMFKAVLER